MIGWIAAFSLAAGVWFLGFGLWQHDWRVIVASFILMALVPLVAEQSRFERDRRRDVRRLDRLWDDDELSDSA